MALTTAIPIWVRVPGTIVLVLFGVLVSTMLIGAAGIGGGGPGMHTPVQNQEQPVGNQEQPVMPGDNGGHRPPRGGHG
jgi:hypothetical protein